VNKNVRSNKRGCKRGCPFIMEDRNDREEKKKGREGEGGRGRCAEELSCGPNQPGEAF
jgi:hypothetical protein